MAVIKEDGVYSVGDAVTGSRFQFRKGQVVPDSVTFEKVGEWPGEKADAAPANKAEKAAPENKAAPKGEVK